MEKSKFKLLLKWGKFHGEQKWVFSAGDNRVERDPANENFSSCMEMQGSCLSALPAVDMSALSWHDSDRLARGGAPRAW